MKYLSRYRRHRFAGPLLLAFALLIAGISFSVAQAQTVTTTISGDKATLISEGKEIFARGCSSCHGLNAEGGEIAPLLLALAQLQWISKWPPGECQWLI